MAEKTSIESNPTRRILTDPVTAAYDTMRAAEADNMTAKTDEESETKSAAMIDAWIRFIETEATTPAQIAVKARALNVEIGDEPQHLTTRLCASIANDAERMAAENVDSGSEKSGRNIWFDQMLVTDSFLVELKGLIFALEALRHESPVFESKPSCSPEHRNEQAHAVDTLIYTIYDLMTEYDAKETIRGVFRDWEKAEAAFNADLKEVEAKTLIRR